MVLTSVPPQAAACFDASCALPPDLCIRHEGDISRVYQCSTGQLPEPEIWARRSTIDTSAVILMGRVLRASRGADGSQPFAASAAPRPAPFAATIGQQMPRGPDPAVAGFQIPEKPPDPCRTNFAMREPSNQQLDEGNAAMADADAPLALKKYRAAITINSCSVYAWAALGKSLIELGAPQQAVRALEVATRLMPSHHVAWTNLGRAAEASGDRQSAVSAYERALQIQPGHAPAAEGLKRARVAR